MSHTIMSSINSDRLKNAIVFFAKNTKACGKIKLFKLLYLLDFEHFRQTGKSVTGLNYEAWKFGPVPRELSDTWAELRTGKSESVQIVDEPQVDYVLQAVKVRSGVDFDDENFTPRQIKILHNLSERYADVLSQKMIDTTHQQNGAWDKVWNNGQGAQRVIPYELSIPDDAPNRDLIIESSMEARRISPPMENGAY